MLGPRGACAVSCVSTVMRALQCDKPKIGYKECFGKMVTREIDGVDVPFPINPQAACKCHVSCATCGYNGGKAGDVPDDHEMPSGPDDCITCDVGEVTPMFPDGTGKCKEHAFHLPGWVNPFD